MAKSYFKKCSFLLKLDFFWLHYCCAAVPHPSLQGELGFSQILCVIMHYSYHIDLGWLDYSFARILKVFRTDCPPRKTGSIRRFGKCPQK